MLFRSGKGRAAHPQADGRGGGGERKWGDGPTAGGVPDGDSGRGSLSGGDISGLRAGVDAGRMADMEIKGGLQEAVDRRNRGGAAAEALWGSGGAYWFGDIGNGDRAPSDWGPDGWRGKKARVTWLEMLHQNVYGGPTKPVPYKVPGARPAGYLKRPPGWMHDAVVNDLGNMSLTAAEFDYRQRVRLALIIDLEVRAEDTPDRPDEDMMVLVRRQLGLAPEPVSGLYVPDSWREVRRLRLVRLHNPWSPEEVADRLRTDRTSWDRRAADKPAKGGRGAPGGGGGYGDAGGKGKYAGTAKVGKAMGMGAGRVAPRWSNEGGYSRSGVASSHAAGWDRSRSPYAEGATAAEGKKMRCGHEWDQYDGGCPECQAQYLGEVDRGGPMAASISGGTVKDCGHPGNGLDTRCDACMAFAAQVARIFSDEKITASGRRDDGEAWPVPTGGAGERLDPLPGLTVQELARMRGDPVITHLMEGGLDDSPGCTLTLHQAREAHVCIVAMLGMEAVRRLYEHGPSLGAFRKMWADRAARRDRGVGWRVDVIGHALSLYRGLREADREKKRRAEEDKGGRGAGPVEQCQLTPRSPRGGEIGRAHV